jgi:hypothetical protein
VSDTGQPPRERSSFGGQFAGGACLVITLVSVAVMGWWSPVVIVPAWGYFIWRYFLS